MNYRELKKILNESLINPGSVGGILGLILDANNPDYFEQRAMELIQEARILYDSNEKIGYHHKMKMAITLLALARLQRSGEKNETE